MTVVQPDAQFAYMNYVQFMQHCIEECLSYEEYVQSAKLCGKYAVTAEAYGRQMHAMEDEAEYWASL